MAARYLIAIGLPSSDGMRLPHLPYVEHDVDAVAAVLTREHGYQRVLADDIPLGAPAPVIRRELSAWFGSPGRRDDDLVVVYIAGHGGPAGRMGRHHLFTTDSTPLQPGETAIQTGQLASLFFEGAGTHPGSVLLILDTCYSASGGGEIAAMIGGAKEQFQGGDGSGFWIIASAGPASGAADGAFVSAWLKAIKSRECSPAGGAEHVDLSVLLEEINKRLRHENPAQEASADALGIGRARQRFFRNFRVTSRNDGMALADEAHWQPKARGVDQFSSAGWFFTGRQAALRELVSWLKADGRDGRDSHDGKARVVTGIPGAGKSALLAWVVLCAHRRTRKEMADAGVALDPDTTPDIGSIDLAMHARGMNVDVAMAQLASRLRAPDPSLATLIRTLHTRRGVFRLIVDALDEAEDPTRWERELLLPLAADPHVRLIVGGRRMRQVVPLAHASVTIDLDSREYFDPRDIARYVEARLTRATPPTGYANQARHLDARRLGQQVAAQANGSFLYARVVSRRLGADPPIDTSRDGWERLVPLPEDLKQAFDEDLERFADDRRWIEDLLVPLAYSRGKGLPQKQIWALLASRLAGSKDDRYTNGHIRALKDKAGFYLIQDTDGGEVVFRLFHQEFAEFLKDKTRHEDVEARIAETLWALDDPPRGHGGWLRRSEPYVLAHLPAHAASGGLLPRLLVDPQFLLKMPTESLLPHLVAVTGDRIASIARAYRKISAMLRGRDEPERCAYLSMSLMQEGALDMCRALEQIGLPSSWKPAWAQWTPPPPSHALAKGSKRITSLDTALWEPARPVALVGREDGVSEVWDLQTGEQLAAWTTDHPGGWTRHLALANTASGRYLIAAWAGREWGLRHIESGIVTRQGIPPTARERKVGDPNAVTALCVADRADGVVCVTADNELRLTIWSVPDLQPIAQRTQATAGAIYRLRVVPHGERLVLASVGDSLAQYENARDASTLRLWSLEDLELLWEDGHGAERPVMEEVERVSLFGRAYLLTSQDSWGPSDLWDIERHTRVYRGEAACARSWVYQQDGQSLLISARFGNLHVYRLDPSAESFSATRLRDDIPIGGGRYTSMLTVHGRTVLLSAVLVHVRVWDVKEMLESSPATAAAPQATKSISSRALVAGAHARELFVGTWDGSVASLDAATGARNWTRAVSTDSRVNAIDYNAAHRAIVAGDVGGTIHVLDATAPDAPMRSFPSGSFLETLAVFEWEGDLLIAAAVESSRVWAARVWNARTGKEVSTRGIGGDVYAYSLAHGQEDKQIGAIAIARFDAVVRLAFASKYSKVMVADYGLPPPERAIRDFDEWFIPDARQEYVRAMACGVVSDGTCLLAAGTEHGHLAIWDFGAHLKQTTAPTAELLTHRPDAHLTEILAIAFRPVAADRQDLIAAGGTDGIVRFWTPALEERQRIEIGHDIYALAWLGPDRLAVGTQQGVIALDLDEQRLAAPRRR